MTEGFTSFRLSSVKWIAFLLTFSLLLGLQESPRAELFPTLASTESHDHQEETQISVLQAIEFLLTGSLNHSHEHEGSTEEAHHEHSHEHQYSGFGISSVFLVSQIQLSFSLAIQTWIHSESPLQVITFYSEILRPPIFT